MRSVAVLAATILLLLLPGSASATPVDGIINHVFGARHDATARCVSRNESSKNPRAVSPTDDHGLFQINGSWFGHLTPWVRERPHRIYVVRKLIYDPLYNARVAYRISKAGTNWNPWTVFRLLGLCHGLS